jgi:epoxyqueuosine reductase
MTQIVTTADELAELLAVLCPEQGIDLAGVLPLPTVMPHGNRWLDWIESGHHGDLDYLLRDAEKRPDPTQKNPWARSMLVFAHRYTAGWEKDDQSPASTGTIGSEATPWTSRVSRYARGSDYHNVLLKSMKRVLVGLKETWPDLKAFPSTDTGPYLERESSWLAGLGFMGRNCCLIHEKLGSGLFLGVALANLDISGLPAPGTPAWEPLYSIAKRRRTPPAETLLPPAQLCGSCTRCLDACPTEALSLHGGLDAGRCLSTWTIEWQGKAPDGEQALQGGVLFGCDICQAVCPWNQRAAAHKGDMPQVATEYHAIVGHDDLTLADLAKITDEEFRTRFRKTPLWRCHPAGMKRNAQVVLGNMTDRQKHE